MQQSDKAFKTPLFFGHTNLTLDKCRKSHMGLNPGTLAPQSIERLDASVNVLLVPAKHITSLVPQCARIGTHRYALVRLTTIALQPPIAERLRWSGSVSTTTLEADLEKS